MTVNICGVPHLVVGCRDTFDADCHFGQINYKECVIRINENMPDEMQEATLVHEMLHGILSHLGYNNLANDEVFVCGLANEIYRGFSIREESKC